MAKKILIVDDDLFIREIYEQTLKTNGFDVEIAVDGEEGLRKLQNGGYDLVLLDNNLPKMDGLEILGSLSQNPPKIANGPIIMLTNSSPDLVIKEALEKGAKTYFIKADLTPDQLLNNVKSLLIN